MDKRYQVFVSSTYEDLQEERREVMQALLELDCIPSGMELFPADDDDQWAVIKGVIDDCDYYILILGARYGSCGKDGVGYTEMEFRYALSVSKPILVFLHKNPGKIIDDKHDKSPQGREKFNAFRLHLEETRIARYWLNAGDLKAAVVLGIAHLKKTKPAVGWVRADQLADKEAVEMVKLHRRIKELEEEMAKLNAATPVGTEEWAQGDDVYELRYGYTQFDGSGESEATGKISATWNEIFSLMAPMMMTGCSERQLSDRLVSYIEARQRRRLEVPEDGISYGGLRLDVLCFDAIKVQLKALGLITHDENWPARLVEDTRWVLTRYGNEVMTQLLARKRTTSNEQII